MTKLPIIIKQKAVSLRKKGFSLKEISDKLDISKSTASLWVNKIVLSNKAMNRLKTRKKYGQYKSILLRQKIRSALLERYLMQAKKDISEIILNQKLSKLLCSLIYYCEGIKTTDTLVTFINSDPSLITVFLKLLRYGFPIHESKFRIIMHLHSYHKENVQKLFWSKITDIPISQFRKTYVKPNTQKRIRINYAGCVSIRYYDAIIAKELHALYKAFCLKLGP